MTNSPPALWNVHGNDVWRTNNYCEGWHNRFNRKHHLNICLFLRGIQQEQAARELLHQQLTKSRLDKFWSNQEVLYNYKADLHGTGNRSIID